ncbi:M16 family metallopeptidase [Bacteroidota bacterium]
MSDKKNKPPINYDIPDFRFPEYEIQKIDNDINLYVISDKTQLLSGISVLFPRGAYHENINGLAYFTSQLLRRGTKNRTPTEIAQEIDSMGAMLNTSAHWDFTSIGLICLNEFVEKGMEILADCIFNPVFPEEEISGFKKKHIADIEQELADPSYLAGIALNNAMFSGHPYGHPLLGDPQSIETISRDNCINWHKSMLIAGQSRLVQSRLGRQPTEKIHIVASGNIDSDYISTLITKFFKPTEGFGVQEAKTQKPIPETRNKDGTFEIPDSENKKKSKRNRIIITEKKEINQTILRIGKFTENRDNPDFPALQFINTIFGGFFLSRLNEILREKLGYTYGVHSYINARQFSSTQIISTSINKETTSDAVRRIIEQMELMSKTKISESEYFLVRQYLLGSFVRGLETARQIASLVTNLLISKLSGNYYDNFYKKVKEISIEDLYDCQMKYYKPEGLVISAVGNSDFLKKELMDFGETELSGF